VLCGHAVPIGRKASKLHGGQDTAVLALAATGNSIDERRLWMLVTRASG
jgi:hypothetical protein